jgi:hypothetical protein
LTTDQIEQSFYGTLARVMKIIVSGDAKKKEGFAEYISLTFLFLVIKEK